MVPTGAVSLHLYAMPAYFSCLSRYRRPPHQQARLGHVTFHEASARSPNRAETVRAHNWVEMRDLLSGRAWVYDRPCRCQYKQLQCRWAVRGAPILVYVFAVAMEGYRESWFLVTTGSDLMGAHVVDVFTARFQQEYAFRDHKQWLGMKECRAWTKEPLFRTFQVQSVALTLLRLLQDRLNQVGGPEIWGLKPEWDPHRRHGSILDLRRLLWRYRIEFSQLLVDLEPLEKLPLPLALQQDPGGRVA
jgi:hypothetical protein